MHTAKYLLLFKQNSLFYFNLQYTKTKPTQDNNVMRFLSFVISIDSGLLSIGVQCVTYSTDVNVDTEFISFYNPNRAICREIWDKVVT